MKKTTKRLLSGFLSLGIIMQCAGAFAASNKEDFQSGEFSSAWTLPDSGITIGTDPTDETNKTLHLNPGGWVESISQWSFDSVGEGSKKADVRFRLFINRADSNDNSAAWHGILLKQGNSVIASLGAARDEFTTWWYTAYFANTRNEIFKQGQAEYKDLKPYTKISGGLNGKTWYRFRVILDFETQTMDTYCSAADITDSMIESGDGILQSVLDIPFNNQAAYIDNLSIGAPWMSGSRDVMYDDISVSDMGPVTYNYSVKDAKYTVENNEAHVTALIKKGENNGIVFTGIYAKDGRLLGVDADLSSLDSSVAPGTSVSHNKTVAYSGEEAYAKIMIWDGSQKPLCEFMQIESSPLVTPAPTPVPTDDPNDISDVDEVPYTPADITRPEVVSYVPKEDIKAIPEALSDTVYRTYPEGKMKAFLLSFDDGPGAQDLQVTIPLLEKNNLTSAFNFNLKNPESAGTIAHIDNEAGTAVWVNNYYSEAFKTWFVEGYKNYEISNHGTYHKPVGYLSKDGVREEIGENKFNMEEIFNREAPGYIQSWVDTPKDPNPASSVWTDAYLKYTGHRYYRFAPLKNNANASHPSGLIYDVSEDFMRWNPTIKVTDHPVIKDNSGNQYSSKDVLQYLLDTDPQKDLKVFFGWGHSSDVSQMTWGSPYKITTKTNYQYLEELCTIAGQNLDTLWNPTPIGFVDYVNASRLTEVKDNGDGTVTITNPSKSIDVWMNVKGENVTIPAGGTVTK